METNRKMRSRMSGSRTVKTDFGLEDAPFPPDLNLTGFRQGTGVVVLIGVHGPCKGEFHLHILPQDHSR